MPSSIFLSHFSIAPIFDRLRHNQYILFRNSHHVSDTAQFYDQQCSSKHKSKQVSYSFMWKTKSLKRDPQIISSYGSKHSKLHLDLMKHNSKQNPFVFLLFFPPASHSSFKVLCFLQSLCHDTVCQSSNYIQNNHSFLLAVLEAGKQ